MKKKIFISIGYMEIGGAEISLIGLLYFIDYARYDVDLFVYSHKGDLMRFIPKQVNLLPEKKNYAHISVPMKSAFLHGCWGVLLGRLIAKCLKMNYLKNKKVGDSFCGYQFMAYCVSPFLPTMSNQAYDLAISFLQPHNFVLNKVEAKKKICWIHTDYSCVHVNAAMELPIWRAYDHIMSISPDVTKSFLHIFPSLKDKIIEMENILSPAFVRQRAEEFDASSEMTGIMKLLSIGRFSHAKNYDNVPDICRRMIKADDIGFRWFIIGYGPDEKLIRDRIAEAGLEDRIIILGKKSNPYPYIKACDIYVQPSRYEGKSVTVREAQMLYKPVVVTNYPTASSQIIDGKDGVIVPMDNQGCAEGILQLIQDKTKQQEIIDYLHTHDYGNEREVEKLYELL